LNVNPEINPPVPLEAVATFEEAIGPSEVRRLDQRRAVVVSANLTTLDLSGEVERIGEVLDGLENTDLLEGVSWEIAGQNREMVRSLTSMQFALALAIFLVYLIMASTFESVVHPLVILFSVPLALVGVVAVLGMTQTAVSVVVFIGAIVLAGVVVNNAIVLVTTINQRRETGMPRLEAIRVAAALRLRPILITTMTTVLGLLPLALGLGDGAEVQRPLALTVIAGLASSTVLTLVVIPVVYLLATRLLEKKRDADQEQGQ
jgi:HAE1 family hydrophobic/amphiphilic exporter-1